MMSRYIKGRRLEYKVRDMLRTKGYVVIRAVQSKPIDLICIKDGRVLLIECKTQQSALSKDRKAELLKLAKISGALLLLASRKKHKIELTDLETNEPFPI